MITGNRPASLLDFSQLDAELLSRQHVAQHRPAAGRGALRRHLRLVLPARGIADRSSGEHVSLQRRNPDRRRPHLRGRLPQPEIAKLFPRRYSVKQEQGVYHFHQLYAAAMSTEH